ncbi:Cadherin EGF LAG seven-pass G-type receptor 1 [Thelohanellus kitauei]|uniref:Cadherin EGF LAG seven-pass G-type receptor 1 n=1 Tax=Thelohanellus kitauei TaxID=669202 RepID=A0A0C2IWB6_THEKT|nr:Cadherin EGF LAG seven-pass G-type receptor 1 [Thelohanellus kitauei]
MFTILCCLKSLFLVKICNYVLRFLGVKDAQKYTRDLEADYETIDGLEPMELDSNYEMIDFDATTKDSKDAQNMHDFNDSINKLSERVQSLTEDFKRLSGDIFKRLALIEKQIGNHDAAGIKNGVAYTKSSMPRAVCPRDYILGVSWSATPGGQSFDNACPDGLTGKVTRYCKYDGSWGTPQLFNCKSMVIANLSTRSSKSQLADHLRLVSEARYLLSGELIQVVSYLNASNLPSIYAFEIINILLGRINFLQWKAVFDVILKLMSSILNFWIHS